jgi:uncharacterized membrane protein SpoIIM required for sporulation
MRKLKTLKEIERMNQNPQKRLLKRAINFIFDSPFCFFCCFFGSLILALFILILLLGDKLAFCVWVIIWIAIILIGSFWYGYKKGFNEDFYNSKKEQKMVTFEDTWFNNILHAITVLYALLLIFVILPVSVPYLFGTLIGKMKRKKLP